MRKARLATFIGFGIGGSTTGVWSAHIPSTEASLGISHAFLGTLLLLTGVGAFSAMRTTGRMIDRRGARPVVMLGGYILAAAIVVLAVAPHPAVLAIGLFTLGYGVGTIDISINSHGVAVEQGYGRPIFSAFHAMWSGGGVIGAGFGIAGLALGLERWITIPAWALIVVGVTFAMRNWLLPREEERGLMGVKASPKNEQVRLPRLTWRTGLGYAVFLAMMASFSHNAEGSAGSWSALQMVDVLGSSEQQGALAFTAFSAAMLVGRLTADKVVARFGSNFVIRWGALSAALALLLVVFAWHPAVAIAGWAALGLGLSGVVPQIFKAAALSGSEPGQTGRSMATVVGISYIVSLAGPVLIGFLTNFVPLNFALLLPTVLVFIVFLCSGRVRTAPLWASEKAKA